MSEGRRVKLAKVQILLLASRYDFTCDYVVAHLARGSIPYLRLNTEDLGAAGVVLDPIEKRLEVEMQGHGYCVSADSLRSVLFRRPVFMRDYGDERRAPAARFSQHQWAVFVCNLMIFNAARWVNHPAATYQAEHKAVQLSVAAELGFAVPETRISNAPHPHLLGESSKKVAIKGLDTVLIRADGNEMFGFTTFEDAAQLRAAAWQSVAATFQDALSNKLDIRVTVVEAQVFAAAITVDGNAVADDWRTHKQDTEFRPFDLPPQVAARCCALVKRLGLVFGAIDLALCDGVYYFLEINPTGEWAWLVDSAGLPIDKAIADVLSR